MLYETIMSLCEAGLADDVIACLGAVPEDSRGETRSLLELVNMIYAKGKTELLPGGKPSSKEPQEEEGDVSQYDATALKRAETLRDNARRTAHMIFKDHPEVARLFDSAAEGIQVGLERFNRAIEELGRVSREDPPPEEPPDP